MSSTSYPPQKSEAPKLTTAQIRQAIQGAIKQANPHGRLVNVPGTIIALTLALSPLLGLLWPSWWMLTTALTSSVGLLLCIIILHECAHKSFFSSKSANAVVGTIMGVVLFMPFGSYKRGHQAHHKWSGNPQKDPTPAPQIPQSPKPILDILLKLRIFPILYWGGVHGPYLIYDVAPTAHKRRLKHVLTWLASLVTGAILVNLIIFFSASPWSILTAYVLGLWGAGLLYDYLFTLHHHLGLKPPESKPRFSPSEQMNFARSIQSPIDRYIFYFNFHKEHHLAPGLPFYVLPHLHRNLREINPGLYNYTDEAWRFEHRPHPFHILSHPHKGDP